MRHRGNGTNMTEDAAETVLERKATAQRRALGVGSVSLPRALGRALSLAADALWGMGLAARSTDDGVMRAERAVDRIDDAALLVLLENEVGPCGLAAIDREVVTGISRAGTYKTTSITVGTHDMASLVASFKAIVEVAGTTTGGTAVDGFGETAAAADATDNFLATALATSEDLVGQVTDIATKLGQSEKSIENQQEFLSSVVDNIDAGVGSMIDANMEEEAARLQALQVQQQLATQSLSIANQAPQNILSLFR